MSDEVKEESKNTRHSPLATRHSQGLTDQQATAVTRRSTSIHLSSGAGCGKTHVLVERYLSHLELDGASIGEIVAITFTERAARQMRERIDKALRSKRDSALPSERATWNRHLRDLESAPISTIHAFCGNLLRQYGPQVGLDPAFEILDDVLSSNVRWATLREEMQTLLTATGEAGDSLRHLTIIFGWRRLQETFLNLISNLNLEEAGKFSAQPEMMLQSKRKAAKKRLLKEYVDYILHGDPTVGKHLGILHSLNYVRGALPGRIEELQIELLQLPHAPNTEVAVKRLEELTKKPSELGSYLVDANDLPVATKALENLRGALKRRLEAFAPNEEFNGSDFAIALHFIKAASHLVKSYRLRKRERAIVDFDDLLQLARNLVKSNPAIRESLSKRYRFILLDELQDTDPTQMELVSLICGEVLKAGKLFAVGDAKQSIYRFRGADVTLFEKLRQDIPADGRLDLSRNFRSQKAILEFVNALFRPAFKDYVPLEAHHTHQAEKPAVEFLWTFPPVDAERPSSVEEVRQREARFLARRIIGLISRKERRVWDKTAKAFREVQLGDITLLFRSMSHAAIYEEALREREIDYYLIGGRAFFAQQEIYDVLNVLRAIENASDTVSLAGYLRSPMGGLSDETLFLLMENSARSGADLWSALVEFPLPLIAEKNSPENEEVKRHPTDFSVQTGGPHYIDPLPMLPKDQSEALQRNRRFLQGWRSIKDRVSIAELLQKIIDDTGYDAALQFENLGPRKLANLWKLIDLARTFDETGLFSLADFVERLVELVSRQPREEQAATLPEEANVVKMMTIHQSKGLEFPIVFLVDFNGETRGGADGSARWHPDADLGCVANPPQDEEPPPFSSEGWKLASVADRVADWKEEQRVLYVACTRAIDMLILSGGFEKPMGNAKSAMAHLARLDPNGWLLQLGKVFDLKTGKFLGKGTALLDTRVQVWQQSGV